MNYKIKVYRHFEKEVKKLSKRYKSLKQDLTILAAELMQNPDMGTDLGNGLHKVRMSIASKGKGKRGGARVITLIATLSKEEKKRLAYISFMINQSVRISLIKSYKRS